MSEIKLLPNWTAMASDMRGLKKYYSSVGKHIPDFVDTWLPHIEKLAKSTRPTHDTKAECPECGKVLNSEGRCLFRECSMFGLYPYNPGYKFGTGKVEPPEK
jgi:hypothetical protein